jgi:putative heme iron utilization protein
MDRLEPSVPAFDAVGLGKSLLRATRSGALATLDRETGGPLATLVTIATAVDGAPLLLLSRLSGHTLNLEADPRLSILLAQGGKGDPLAHPRLSVVGRAERVEDASVRRRFLARHPKAQLYADFPDFSFWRVALEAGHLNGGFARAARLGPGDLLTDLVGAEALLDAEEGALAHMNEDHRDALALYATALANAPQADWRATGLDPDGIDLAAGDRAVRVPFPQRVTGPGPLRAVLKAMADGARSAPAGEGQARLP